MRNIDFFEIYKSLDINYTNKQVNSCSSINLKKDSINQEAYSRENLPPENDRYKHREDGIYLDINFSSISLQPCIAIKDKSFRLPIFELTYDFQVPNVTYQVKQNSRLYEEIYSLVYLNYINSTTNDEMISLKKIRISETKPIFEISEKENSYSIFWDSADIKSNTSILLGEITGLLYNNEKKYCNKYSFELPNISNEELNVILDASHYCNEFIFLKHCRLPFPFDDQRIRPNTQLQWLFIDKWPHLVVLTIPGIDIKQGDELFVDFGDNYHMYYVNYLKTIFKDMIKIRVDNTQIFRMCSVCRFEIENDITECEKCAICHEYIHGKCGYCFKNDKSICFICLKNSFKIIFGINEKFNNPLNRRSSDSNKDSIIGLLKVYDGNACEECLSLFSKKDSELDRRKSVLFCKLIHEFYQKDKHPDSVDSFYAEYGSKCDAEVKQSINLDFKALDNFYNFFERLIKYLKEFWDENRQYESLKLESNFLQEYYIGFSNKQSKFLFPDPSIYETWDKSKWKDFIYWDQTKNCWIGILRPNGIFSRFTCCNKYPTIIDTFYEAEKWVEQRISETTISKNLISVIFSDHNKIDVNNEKHSSKSPQNTISHTYYHSPYLPTDLASHPDYKIFNCDNETSKYRNNLSLSSESKNSFSANDNQLILNSKTKSTYNISNTESQLYSYSNSPEFLINDLIPRVSSTGFIQCCSPVNRKRRIRSTLPLTSNAARCPTEWRVRGITWHAERKAFIVPYRRDKDGGLTSTTFGAMKYGSPLTAFLKALEFRENYLKEQSMKLPEEIKQPSVICDQALLIRNLPNIIWDSNKLVWRAIADEEVLCDDNLTHKLNYNSQDIEINALPYGARIAYEIAEVCYIRRKALLLNSKGNLQKSSSVSRLRNKSSSTGGFGAEYQLILEDQRHSILSKDSHIDATSPQSSCFKQIKLKIIFPTGEEVIRSDLIAWHFRSNSWVITNMMDESTSNKKNISSLNYSDSNIKQKSLIQSLICAIECCTLIPPKCQVYVNAEEAESIIDSEDLAELLKPFPTGISWYCKKRRFYTSNGLDSNGRGQHFSIALYGSLIAAFNAAIDYRNIFLKNRRKAILPKVEWILCFPVSQSSISVNTNERIKGSNISSEMDIVKNLDSCNIYNLSDNYLASCSGGNIERINSQISPLNTCISGDAYHSGGDWLQHPTTVSLLDDQIIESQNDLESRILNIELIE